MKVLRRLLWAAGTLLGLALLVFVLTRAVPADPVAAMAGPRADAETRARIRQELGLDRPLWEQFVGYVARAVQGDLGKSYITGEDVAGAIAARFPSTAILALAGVALWLGIGIPLGVLTARYRDTPLDWLVVVIAMVGISLPAFWVGRLLQYEFAYRLQWFPVAGLTSPAHLVLPALTLGIAGAGFYARLVHSSLIEVMGQEYVLAARARGLSEAQALWRHGLPNAMLPVLSVLGTDVAALLAGVTFTESVFAIPGLGRLGVEAILNLDPPMMLGTVLFAGLLVVASNLAVDLLYAVLDPRVRVGGAR
jgi:peptide/nickel transport system permease protein